MVDWCRLGGIMLHCYMFDLRKSLCFNFLEFMFAEEVKTSVTI